MRREREAIQRQVALVSYGSSFLRKDLAFEDWYRHSIFFGARLQFREPSGNALLADDFTQWLAILAQGGATRLSLHSAAVLGVEAPQALDRCSQVVAVHYADRYQLWAVGRERATREVEGQHVPNAASYGGEVDCYLCVEERPGQIEVPPTDWKKLAAAIASDLDIPVPSGSVAAEPFFAYTRESAEWAKKPLFVAKDTDALAHRILATLDLEQGKFDNDTNPKNDSARLHFLDEEGTEAFLHWGKRLASWIGEVQLRAANIDRATAGAWQDAPLSRLQPPPPPRQPVQAAVQEQPFQPMPVVEAKPPAESKWVSRFGLVVGIGALSLFILALAKVIGFFPWLAVLFALPFALYMHYKD